MPFADNLELLKVGLAERYSRQSFRSKITGINFDCFFLSRSVLWSPTMGWKIQCRACLFSFAESGLVTEK
jgi:hypothetical protein